MSQQLPAATPDGTGRVHSRISTVATISLSATGSKKAPKAEVTFYGGGKGKEERK